MNPTLKKIIVVYLCGYLVSAVLIAGMDDAYSQGRYSDNARDNARRDMGDAVAEAISWGLWWPFTLPLMYCTTGFAQYGLLYRFKPDPSDAQ